MYSVDSDGTDMTEKARRSRDGDENSSTTTVLYIDADAATRERIIAAMTDHRPTLSVSGAASVAAGLDIVASASKRLEE